MVMKPFLALLMLPLGFTAMTSHASSVYVNVGYGSSTIPAYQTPVPCVTKVRATALPSGVSVHSGVARSRVASSCATPVVVTQSCPPRIHTPVYPVSQVIYYQTGSSTFGTTAQEWRQQLRGFEQLGYDWGRDVRREIASWESFVDYIKSNLLNAFSSDRDHFKRGFLSAYGVNAEAAWDKAWNEAENS